MSFSESAPEPDANNTRHENPPPAPQTPARSAQPCANARWRRTTPPQPPRSPATPNARRPQRAPARPSDAAPLASAAIAASRPPPPPTATSTASTNSLRARPSRDSNVLTPAAPPPGDRRHPPLTSTANPAHARTSDAPVPRRSQHPRATACCRSLPNTGSPRSTCPSTPCTNPAAAAVARHPVVHPLPLPQSLQQHPPRKRIFRCRDTRGSLCRSASPDPKRSAPAARTARAAAAGWAHPPPSATPALSSNPSTP